MMEMAVFGPLQMITGAKTPSEMATAGLCKGMKAKLQLKVWTRNAEAVLQTEETNIRG